VVLLHLLKRYRNSFPATAIKVVHINHALSPNADKWQSFCQSICHAWDMPFYCAKVNVSQGPRQSIEQEARIERYRALAQYGLEDSTLLLGHHLDDQVETFFIRLKRGSGLLGLGGMKVLTTLATEQVALRPLLRVKRTDLEQYAREQQLKHIEDESNQDVRFDRNFLRQQVLPMLNQRFAGFNSTVLRVTELLQKQQSLLNDYLAIDADHCIVNNLFNLDKVKGFSSARIESLIRYWLEKNRLILPSQKLLSELIDQALQAKPDAQVSVQCKGFAVKNYQNKLYICLPVETLSDHCDIGVDAVVKNNICFDVEFGKGVRLPLPDEQVNLRFNIGTLKFNLAGRNCTKTVNNWLREKNMPPWLRPRVAGIFYNDTLVQVIGLGLAQSMQDEKGLKWHQQRQQQKKN
jgi:tRNA(Ile)-lysidine synthase